MAAGVLVRLEHPFAFWYPNKMYDEGELIQLIPDKWSQYHFITTRVFGAGEVPDVDVVETKTVHVPKFGPGNKLPCLHCGDITSYRLSTTKLHPLLGILAGWYRSHVGSIGALDLWAPPFCTTRCLRRFIVSHQTEFLMYLTS
jgi:hypothetical protein